MGTTPIYALPYVEPADQLNTYPAADKAAKEKIELALDLAPSRMSRVKTTTQALPAGTFTTLVYETDEGGAKDITYATGVFTVARAGLYLINICQHFSTGTGGMVIRLYVGSVVAALSILDGTPNSVAVSRTWRVAAGEQLRVEGNNTSGGNAYGNATSRYSFIDITRLSS